MQKRITVVAICMLLFLYSFSQTKSQYNLRGLQYAFNRNEAVNSPQSYTTIYICYYGGAKSGWNAKANDYYPVRDKIVWSRIIRLTGFPPAYEYKPKEAGNVCSEVAELFLKHLVAQNGFVEDVSQVSYVVDYDFNYVEKELAERMDAEIKFHPKIKFLYDTKFSFDYSDYKYKVSYKPQ